MPTNRLIVIGTSAGGIEALRTLLGALPADFNSPICVVMHMAAESPGLLAEILNRVTPLTVVNARNAEHLAGGRVYVAPPDCHLLVEPGRVRVTKGPKENRFRPAIDPLFRSAAQVYGPSAIGVVLTGNLDDGTAGLCAIKQLGGLAVVQDPADALFSGMPRSALQHVTVDYCVPLVELAPLLTRLTAVVRDEPEPIDVPRALEVEVNVAKEKHPVDAGLEEIGEPSRYACPDCHGVLLQMKDAGRLQFRCHTGHAYSPESLLAAVGDGIEDSLWTAIRALEEAALLMHRLANDVAGGRDGPDARRLVERATEARRHSAVIRQVAGDRESLTAKP